jgi:hypothetical protein
VELLLEPGRIEGLAARARKSVEINFDNQRIVQDLCSAYDAAVSNAESKAFHVGRADKGSTYEAFALSALVDLLEGAEQRSVELDGEVRWLRECLNVECFPLKAELGNLRDELGNLREILERSFREIDELFSMSPKRVRRRYAEIANPSDPGEPDKSDRTIEEKWKEALTRISLLKEFFGRRSHRFFRPW